MPWAAVTHPGLNRTANQDRYLARELEGGGWLLAVADGMGGNAGGGLAAEMSLAPLAEITALPPEPAPVLSRLAERADREILRHGKEQPRLEGMGSTLTVVLAGPATCHWLHVGDSRLYLVRGGQLRQLTTDQNLAEFLRSEGELTRVQARRHPLSRILDQCVGCGEVEPELGHRALKPGDTLLLCTDGLYGDLEPGLKTEILARPLPLAQRMELLLSAALQAGGRDNITALSLEL